MTGPKGNKRFVPTRPSRLRTGKMKMKMKKQMKNLSIYKHRVKGKQSSLFLVGLVTKCFTITGLPTQKRNKLQNEIIFLTKFSVTSRRTP